MALSNKSYKVRNLSIKRDFEFPVPIAINCGHTVYLLNDLQEIEWKVQNGMEIRAGTRKENKN